MADQKPPRVVGGDRATLLALLQYQRDSVVRKVEGIIDADARRSPVPSGTSLLWLVEHLADAEAMWVLARFAGEPREPARAGAGSARSLATAVATYRGTWAASTPSSRGPTSMRSAPPPTVR